ncbi:MAG: hypothetical protein LBM60_09350, partial [Clostridium sp.]|nr:hypothetical protein [Clostridium sp.]
MGGTSAAAGGVSVGGFGGRSRGAASANGSDGRFTGAVDGRNPSGTTERTGRATMRNPLGVEETPPGECQTCKNRKYVDGSDENVSFKSASHISPESAASRVRAHEQEHVSNAYSEASQKNGKVVSAAVSIHTAVCPECKRSYVSGGTTRTMIMYRNEGNPYVQQ